MTLPELLEAWRRRPAPALAELIGDVSARLVRTRPLLPWSRKLLAQAWPERERLRDPADLPILLGALRRLNPARVRAFAKLLEEWPADPRTTTFVGELGYRGYVPTEEDVALILAALL